MKKALPIIITVLLLAPLIVWKYINDLHIRFSLALFIIIMTCIYLFFILRGVMIPTEEKTEYRWLQVLLIVVTVFIFGTYSFRLFELIKEIR